MTRRPEEAYIKPLTHLHPSCKLCGLPANTCICSRIPILTTQAQIWILSTEKEFWRPSNTARLLKQMNPESTEIFLWERTRKPEALLNKIIDQHYEPYLLFPAESEAERQRQVAYPISNRTPAFIIIDGTWQEARKIIRKSAYLNALPMISLIPEKASSFTLRRGVKAGNLCTLEAAMEVLKLAGEPESAAAMERVYQLFLKSYKAGACGHSLKE